MHTNGHASAKIDVTLGLKILGHCLVKLGGAAVRPRIARYHSYYYPEQFCFPAQISSNLESPADADADLGLGSLLVSNIHFSVGRPGQAGSAALLWWRLGRAGWIRVHS